MKRKDEIIREIIELLKDDNLNLLDFSKIKTYIKILINLS